VLSVLQALRERRRARLPVSGDLVIVTGLGRHSEVGLHSLPAVRSVTWTVLVSSTDVLTAK
jgi:hypothetical protein